MKGHAYQPLRNMTENAIGHGIRIDVFISTSTGIQSIVGRIDSKDSGSKCGILLDGFVVNTLNPVRVKPSHESYGTVSYADLTWNPSSATLFIGELMKAKKAESIPAESIPAESIPVPQKPKKIIRKKPA